MTQFDTHRKGAEAHYAMGQEARFRIEARTAKLAAQWLADKMGLTGDAVAAYLQSVIAANMAESGLDDLQEKLVADSAAHGLDISEDAIAAEIARCLRQATDELKPTA
ncbi:MAG: DUF1476 domain-containing protein [Pseudomonadota bacterium]